METYQMALLYQCESESCCGCGRRWVEHFRDVTQNDGTFKILITAAAHDDGAGDDDDDDDIDIEGVSDGGGDRYYGDCCCILRLLPSERF
jgi:hypothetical protein